MTDWISGISARTPCAAALEWFCRTPVSYTHLAGAAGGSVIAAVTMSVTAVFDPFFGMLAGIVLKMIIGATGLAL